MQEDEKQKVTHPLVHKKNGIINAEKPLSTTKYVENAVFVENIRKYNAGDKSLRLENEIGLALLKIARGLGQKYQFRGYPFLEDMITEAVTHAWRYFGNFNPDITKNPFAYFTQICYYNFLSTIESEKEALAVKFKSSLHVMAEHSDRILEEVESGDLESLQEYEIDVSGMSEFVDKYDTYLHKKKAKAKKPKKIKGVDKFLE